MVGPPDNDGLPFRERARAYHHRDSLPPEEYEALVDLIPQLVAPPAIDAQCFVLGSYDAEEKRRLEYVRRQIDEWPGGNYRAFLMEDFPDGLHPIVEFQLIADHSDHLIGVCEHDRGGFQLELGMLIAITEYRQQSSLLKRTYPTTDQEHEKYNWMLDAGAFELFDYYDALWEWSDVEEFEAQVDALLARILR